MITTLESWRNLSNVRSHLHAARCRAVVDTWLVRTWIAVGLAGLAIAAVVVFVVIRAGDEPSTDDNRSAQIAATPSGLDPLVEEFRATERTCIQRFNTALREQRENVIDELELSNTIVREVLEPWRALRTKISAAPKRDELYSTLRRYLEARQLSWEAYVTALRAPSDDAARPHYEMHRQKNAEAQEEAKRLGALFRAAAARVPTK